MLCYNRLILHLKGIPVADILVVVPDENERALIADATLIPSGYEVQATGDGATAFSTIMQDPPDLLLLDLEPGGLSAQDLLLALESQSMDIPVIVIGDEGAERDALNAFRLGARDYLLRPIREAELLRVVERIMLDLRLQRDRERLVARIRWANEAAKQRLRELNTLMGVGKSVASRYDLQQILDLLIQAAVQLTRADAVGCYLRDENDELQLSAGHNLSRNLMDRMYETVEDDLAFLVIHSQEAFSSDAEGLRQMPPAQQGVQAVIYAPMVAHNDTVGVLWTANREQRFETHMVDLVSALADYAAIAVSNAHLINELQRRSDLMEQTIYEQQQALSEETTAQADAGVAAYEIATAVRSPLTRVLGNLSMFKNGEMGQIPPGNQAAVDVMHRQISEIVANLDDLLPPDTGGL